MKPTTRQRRQTPETWAETILLELIPKRDQKNPYGYLMGLVDHMTVKQGELTEVAQFIKEIKQTKTILAVTAKPTWATTDRDCSVTISVLEREAQNIRDTLKVARRVLRRAGYSRDSTGWHRDCTLD